MQRKQFFLNCGHIKTTVTNPVKLSDIYETLDDHIKLVKILIVNLNFINSKKLLRQGGWVGQSDFFYKRRPFGAFLHFVYIF